MIDYEKLKKAYAMLDDMPDDWIWLSTKKSSQNSEVTYMLQIGIASDYRDALFFEDIDKLLAKLKELAGIMG